MIISGRSLPVITRRRIGLQFRENPSECLNVSIHSLKFFVAQVIAYSVSRIMCQFDLPSSIRRLKNEAGYTLDLNHRPLAEASK
jgi:hypothetical protein